MLNETEPRVPALQPCPNEECRGECYVDTGAFSGAWKAHCDRCGYNGPFGSTDTEATALHNRMPRTEPWVSVAERMPEDSNLEYYVALATGSVVGPMVWSGLHWQWAQDYSSFRNYEDPGSTPTHWKIHTPPRGPVSR